MVNIDYAAKSNPHARRQRRVAIGIGFIFIAAVALKFLPVAWRNTQLYYWQQRCMNFSQSPDTVVLPISPNAPANPFLTFYNLYSPPGSNLSTVAFVHEMRNPKGEIRMVAVGIIGNGNNENAWPETYSFKPGSLINPPKSLYSRSEFLLEDRVFAGQIDPSDPTHFTIRTISDSGGYERILDGWLQNDDVVNLEIRMR
jgi:hypothetical protein